MGLFDWFRKHETRQAGMGTTEHVEPLTFREGEQRLGGLDMQSALAAHAVWKERLREVFDGRLDMPEMNKVARDDLCLMGQWLHGEGKRTYGEHAAYRKLVRSHSEFHLCVGEALAAHAHGDADAAREGELQVRRNSDRVQLDLVRLFVTTR
jgi:hypothetical protein